MAIAPAQLQPDAAVVTLDAGGVWWPMHLSRRARQGTNWKPSPFSIMAKRPLTRRQADIIAVICWHVGYLRSVAIPWPIPSTSCRSKVAPALAGMRILPSFAVASPISSPLSGAAKSLGGLSAKPARDDCHTIADYQLPVEAGRAIAADLFPKILGGEALAKPNEIGLQY